MHYKTKTFLGNLALDFLIVYCLMVSIFDLFIGEYILSILFIFCTTLILNVRLSRFVNKMFFDIEIDKVKKKQGEDIYEI